MRKEFTNIQSNGYEKSIRKYVSCYSCHIIKAHLQRLFDDLCIVFSSGGHQGDDEVLKWALQLLLEGIHEVLQMIKTRVREKRNLIEKFVSTTNLFDNFVYNYMHIQVLHLRSHWDLAVTQDDSYPLWTAATNICYMLGINNMPVGTTWTKVIRSIQENY